ncbi:Methyl-accepting chemotaxis protein, partial [hydrothermal vent metagenome]
MKILANLSIRNKIFLMLIAPMLGLIYFSVHSVMEKSSVSAEMETVQPLAQLAVKASALVHETQKERGATAGFLGSKGKKFVTELPAQRRSTDQKRAELRAFLKEFDANAYGNEFASRLNDATSRLSQLEGKRSAVSALSIPTKEAICYYTGFNSAMLGVISEMIDLTNNGKISRA